LGGITCFGIVVVEGCDDGTSSHLTETAYLDEGTAGSELTLPPGQTVEP
jgi:hypothetical protein